MNKKYLIISFVVLLILVVLLFKLNSEEKIEVRNIEDISVVKELEKPEILPEKTISKEKKEAKEVSKKQCYVGGCSSHICSDQQNIMSTCEFLPEYACYRDAVCEQQATGECGWTKSEDLSLCIEEAKN